MNWPPRCSCAHATNRLDYRSESERSGLLKNSNRCFCRAALGPRTQVRGVESGLGRLDGEPQKRFQPPAKLPLKYQELHGREKSHEFRQS